MTTTPTTFRHTEGTGKGRYVAIDITAMRALMDEMGFSPLPQRPGAEIVYARAVGNRPVQLRVYSSVTPGNGVSRDVGEDAIRIALHSTLTDRPVGMRFARVYRTKNALGTLKDRAREAWTYARDNACLKCNGVLVERTVKNTGKTFMGCCNYPECK
jgi:hypothetical protein